MNLATWLTAARIIIAPVFAFVFLRSFGSEHPALWLWLAVGLVVLSEITDGLDGIVARAQKQVTDFGRIFDPMADSLARLTAFLCFLLVNIIPWWLFLVFLYRDSFLSLLRIAIASSGTVQGARNSGKIKAVVQAAGILTVLAVCLGQVYNVGWIPDLVLGRPIGFWIILVPALVTVLSVFDYVLPNRQALKRMMTPR